MTPESFQTVNVLGTPVAALDMDGAVEVISDWLAEEMCGRYVCVTGVHGVMEGLRDAAIRNVHASAAACVPDGMPMTWVGRLRGHGGMDRVYGPDLMLRLLDVAARRGYSNYFYGGAEGVAEELGRRMAARFPGLEVVGTYCPPFRPLTPSERADVVSEINRLRPDLLWVGLSTPKQELLMSELHLDLRTKVMLGVGAAFDFHSGRVRQAPRWMMRAGLEWFFRLVTNPRRLASRYLRNNPAFLWHIFLQQTGMRHYPPT